MKSFLAISLLLVVLLGERALQVTSLSLSGSDPLASTSAELLHGDARSYHEWARAEAEGRSPRAGQPYWLPPLYPLALGMLYRATGPSPLAAIITQSLLGIATVLMLYGWCRSILGRGPALAAALCCAAYLPAMFFETRLMPTTLTAFLVMAGLALLESARRRAREMPRQLLHAAAWLVLGLACCARPNLLPLLALLALWFLWRPPVGARRGRALILALPALLAPGACFVRNLIQSGEPILISANGGLNIWFGNRPGAGPSFTAPDHRWTSIARQEREALAEASRSLGHAASHSATEQFFLARAWRARSADPLGTIELVLLKLQAFLGNTEHGVLYLPQVERRIFPVLWIAPLPFALLLALAVVGLFHLPPAGRSALVPAALAALGGALATVLVFHYSRLRLPVLPALFALAGLGLARARPRPGALRTILPLVLGALAAAVSLPDPESHLEHRTPKVLTEMALHRLVALRDQRPLEPAEHGLIEEALAWIEEAESLAHPGPWCAYARFLAARLLGQPERQRAALLALIEREQPDAPQLSPAIYLDLARQGSAAAEEILRDPSCKPTLLLRLDHTLALLGLAARACRDQAAMATEIAWRRGWVVLYFEPGGNPLASIDEATRLFSRATRWTRTGEQDLRRILAPAYFFRASARYRHAGLEHNGHRKTQLAQLALSDYRLCASLLYGDPPQRNLDILHPALAMGSLARELRLTDPTSESAARFADRILAACQRARKGSRAGARR